jgi:aldehyde dehydrogenase (NAD+)
MHTMADNDRFTLEILLDKQRSSPIPSSAIRRKMLLRLKKMLVDHEEAFMKALLTDMGRSTFEAYSFEIAVLLNEIDYMCEHVGSWNKLTHSWHLKFGYVETIRKTRIPYGSVLIISPWNYPLQLALMPAINAIAAGNRCVIKPSEFAPATSELLKKIIGQAFPPEQLTVVTGNAQIAKLLTSLDFDLIFFTGSQQVGKLVAQDAAKRLTPVILELGGKNPCIMDESGFSKEAIQEIVWGKYINAGQTCIAPDTLFVHHTVYERTLAEISTTLQYFYGDQPEASDDYGKICHPAHFQKLIGFISQGHVRYGGTHDANELFIAPTVMTDIQPGNDILQEEIFGPVLPVIAYTDFNTLLSQQVMQRDALTAYIFSKDKQHIRQFKQHMQSTSISVNQVIHHAANPHVAFGGVGYSGHGAYHGLAGFKACSYVQTDYKAYHYMHVKDKFPPYSMKNLKLLKKFRRWFL